MMCTAGAELVLAAGMLAEPTPPLPAWMEVDSHGSSQQAQELYGSWVREAIEKSEKDPARRDELYQGARRVGGGPNWALEKISGGCHGEPWRFFDANPDEWPRAGYRIHKPTTATYRIRIDVLCSTDDGSCEPLWRELAAMRAPAVSPENPARRQWLQIVKAEPCGEIQGSSVEPPAYPLEEQRRLIGGMVEVRGVFNRCGEVRDAVVATSSGNRNLDRGAVRGVFRWQLPDAIVAGASGEFSTTIRFIPPAENQDPRRGTTTVEGVWRKSPTSQ